MTTNEIKAIPGATVFSGPEAVRVYQATALALGLRMYAKSKMLPNRAWTPKNMLRTATGITGKTYKRGEYLKAADDLKAWADKTAATLNATA